tara:strand:- start:524 stop:1108 length:585 start_codon:yes stop_codon:yes gene_type:complete
MAQEKLFLVTHIDQGIHHLQTSRLILRNWKQNDIEPFAILNSDPRVCEFLPNVLSQEETLTSVIKIQSHFKKHAFGLFAVELISTKTFIGFVGLKYFSFDSHFTPSVELAWRLSWENWGQGLATEAAQKVTQYGFETLGLPEILAITAKNNQGSRRVMEKLGMFTNEDENFLHPQLEYSHPLAEHVLYRFHDKK